MEDNSTKLPPETQIGANTFGVTIKNNIYIPRDPKGIDVGMQLKGMYITGSHENGYNYTEIVVLDGASPAGFKIILHIEDLISSGVYTLKESNFHDQIDSVKNTHIFFKIWDSSISNYAYYGSLENQGEINIKRLSDGIISGNFKGKFVRYDNSNDIIEIADGRFDINSQTLPNHPFP